MAKAQFHKNQKVWVESVGAWATIEKIVPVWARGFDEPVRITYDIGLGREFLAHELKAEDAVEPVGGNGERWRLLRAKNKWQTPSECAHHPFPGTYPVVVTDANDWGGWRTPGAEYDRDPHRIEAQARLIACAPRLHAIVATASVPKKKRRPTRVPKASKTKRRDDKKRRGQVKQGRGRVRGD